MAKSAQHMYGAGYQTYKMPSCTTRRNWQTHYNVFGDFTQYTYHWSGHTPLFAVKVKLYIKLSLSQFTPVPWAYETV